MKIRTRARKQLKPSKPAINQVSTVSDNAKDYVSFLDPQKICVGTIPNRHADSYDAESFESLRLSIQCAGGNVQPIRVYSLDAANGQQFVLIYGERRLRACQELGLSVRAVVTHAAPEKQRFFDTVRENQSRADLSAWELGRQLKFAMDQGFFSSQRRLAFDIGRDISDVSRAIKLASLPYEIVAAFASPTDLQFRHSKKLTDAVALNLPELLEEARLIQQLPVRPKALEVFNRLLKSTGDTVGRSNTETHSLLECDGENFGHAIFDNDGRAEIRLEVPLSPKQRVQLLAQVHAFYKRRVLVPKTVPPVA